MNPMIWIGIVTFIIILIIFLPHVLHLWQETTHREQIENALKFLLEREHEGRKVSAESLAGALRLSQSNTLKLIGRLKTQKLVELTGHEMHLTPEGERWALQIVRAHRLWERYLADEARMPLKKVHAEAHRQEHRLTPAEVDALDAILGHPTTDPHGDPIPSRDGRITLIEGVELTNWEIDTPGIIVHLEDEPEIAYTQILAEGLRLGQIIRLIEKQPERYILTDGIHEYLLAPVIAANVHLAKLTADQHLPESAIPLHQLKSGQPAQIITIDQSVQGFTRRRLLDLGLTPGTQIHTELNNFFGDPSAYRIRGTLIALRKEQAAQIWVEPVSPPQTG